MCVLIISVNWDIIVYICVCVHQGYELLDAKLKDVKLCTVTSNKHYLPWTNANNIL